MAHGTPDSLDDMPEYLTLVRGGRTPSPELIEEMRHNYSAIGGKSPLTEITHRQAAALQAALGGDIPVLVGMRTWRPFIAQGFERATALGVTRVLGVPLAPQFSSLSVQKYVDAAMAARPPHMAFRWMRSFHAHPGLIEAFAERVRQAAPLRPSERVVFTAHSLPVRVVDEGDPYADEVKATAAAVARACRLEHYDCAYQSAGRTPEPWLGPDLSDHIRERAAEGDKSLLVVPIGFVCDHTEVLFDIDVQAARTARECGVALRRTESLNTLPAFIAALTALVRDGLAAWQD